MDVAGYDLLSTAVLLLDEAGRVQHANTAAQELFSVSRRQLLGRPVDQLFGGDPELAARLPDAIRGKFGVLRQDLAVERRGDLVPVSLAVVPLQKQEWAALLEVRVLEHHVLLDRHRQLSKELATQRESLRNLAHEVKNPLGGIRGAAQLLEAELAADSLREYTQVIIAEADRLAGLVDRLIAPQGATLKKTYFNIHEICERVYTLVRSEFPGIEFIRDYDASAPELAGDRERLMQALLNMARNAAQALDESGARAAGEITLRTRVGRRPLLASGPAKLGIVVSVIDNGPGVPADLHGKIFHPLVTGRASGTGLGLSLAQEFVQQHGGVVEFDSVPGRTEFRMILPLEQA
ncbi:nitrogen regulation protein NR(II) [Parapusillimonas granuli]|uniref:Sensory histidine kinase/phosphatase NtrB n=1 Tax=Parapusillimonas granuli TaxID=380911 RepID=A0A853G6E0_9BURK|nr:nitrogen regulation protein NR(II) [Parapusillimonas granuli]MBB5214248.1 two-component system nitrogen regulation sensor histidine kinase GlnL [Parapusillimonas granuli]NYT51352.1 PAS domain-containing protein [Parapusillimonas granuli]